MSKTIKARGYDIEITTDGDVTIRKAGSVVVVGMFDAGGLDLSTYSPTGARVAIRDSIVDAIEDKIRAALSGDDDADDDE